jgi:hypothetical protein
VSGPAYYTGTMNIATNDDWVVPFIYATQNADGSAGPPIDLTGSTLMMEIRHQVQDHEVVVTLTSPDNGIIITNAVAGAFTIVIPRDTLEQLEPGSYVSDLVRLMPNGFQERLLDCAVTVAEGVTR